MKLTYRGISYNYQPEPIETRETAVTGKYRGISLKFHANSVTQ